MRQLWEIYAKVASWRGVTKRERRRIRTEILKRFDASRCQCSADRIAMAMQDMTFPVELRSAKKVMVFLVPQQDGISGGVFSLFSIANHMRRLKRHHGYEVVLMTLPSSGGQTYFRNTSFRNAENVYRISQIELCEAAREVYLLVPEYAVEYFCKTVSSQVREYLGGKERVSVNICNQNIELMPGKDSIDQLHCLADCVSQSVAHHAYFSQEVADRFGLPTLLLPAYTDLSAYPAAAFAEKENLIIHSPDDAPYKKACLNEIARKMPDYELVEIRGITFDKYMDLATRCKYSITFGEGFDGYLAQPIYQGGVGFAVYNTEFFPAAHLLQYENIFSSGDEMIANVCDVMRRLERDEDAYSRLNRAFMAEYHKLYSYDEYVDRVRKLAIQQFDYFPAGDVGAVSVSRCA